MNKVRNDKKLCGPNDAGVLEPCPTRTTDLTQRGCADGPREWRESIKRLP